MIATSRLRLRPLVDGDLEALLAYRRDPEVARYQSWSENFKLVAEVGGRIGLQLVLLEDGYDRRDIVPRRLTNHERGRRPRVVHSTRQRSV